MYYIEILVLWGISQSLSLQIQLVSTVFIGLAFTEIWNLAKINMFIESGQLIGIFFWKKTGKASHVFDTFNNHTCRTLFFLHPFFCDLCAFKFSFHHQFKFLPLYLGISCGHKHIRNNKLFYLFLCWKLLMFSYKLFETILKRKTLHQKYPVNV